MSKRKTHFGGPTGAANYVTSFSGPVAAGDPDWSDVSLLLPCNGPNGSSTFTDVSNAHNLMTPSGDAQISDTNPKFGSGAYINIGANPILLAQLSTPLTPGGPLDLSGGGDFTVEGWFEFPVGVGTGNTQIIYDCTDGLTNGFRIYWTDLGTPQVAAQGFGGTPFSLSNSGIVADNLWHAFALVLNAGELSLYIDGVSANPPVAEIITGPMGGNLLIGASSNSAVQDTYFAGQLDEIRVTKGIARYTSNYTPATAAFPTS